MMLFVMMLLWFGSGLLAFGIHNHYIRYKYHSLYIENYYGSGYEKERRQITSDEFLVLFSVIGGPCALVAALVSATTPYGLCFMTRRWTQEEAAKLFPFAHTWEMERKYRS